MILFINSYNNHGIKTNNMNSVTVVIIKQNSVEVDKLAWGHLISHISVHPHSLES